MAVLTVLCCSVQWTTPYQSFMVRYVHEAVYGRYACAGIDRLESAVTSGEFQNGIKKALVDCSPDFFVVLKILTVQMCFTGAYALICNL